VFESGVQHRNPNLRALNIRSTSIAYHKHLSAQFHFCIYIQHLTL
jgi:hypothetical protein